MTTDRVLNLNVWELAEGSHAVSRMSFAFLLSVFAERWKDYNCGSRESKGAAQSSPPFSLSGFFWLSWVFFVLFIVRFPYVCHRLVFSITNGYLFCSTPPCCIMVVFWVGFCSLVIGKPIVPFVFSLPGLGKRFWRDGAPERAALNLVSQALAPQP